MNCPLEVTTSFELRLDSRIEFYVIGSDSSVNQPTRLKSVMGEDVGLDALKVTTCRISVKG